MLGWEMIEAPQFLPIFSQASCGFRKLQLIRRDELIEGLVGGFPSLSPSDLGQGLLRLEPADRLGGQTWRIGSQQRTECFREVSCRDPFQVQQRQQLLDAFAAR